MELQEALEFAVKQGIVEGIKNRFERGYNSPLDKVIESAVEVRIMALRPVLEEAIESVVNDAAFREEVIKETRSKFAKVLVQRFGGEMEKQVNALKSDPTTRARIVMAIEEIVKGKI